MKLTINKDKKMFEFGILYKASNSTEYGYIYAVPFTLASEAKAWEMAKTEQDIFGDEMEDQIKSGKIIGTTIDRKYHDNK